MAIVFRNVNLPETCLDSGRLIKEIIEVIVVVLHESKVNLTLEVLRYAIVVRKTSH